MKSVASGFLFSKATIAERRQRGVVRLLKRASGDKRTLEAVDELRDAILRSILSEERDSGVIVALTGASSLEDEDAGTLPCLLARSFEVCRHRSVAFLDGRFDEDRFTSLSTFLGLERNAFLGNKGTTEIQGFYNRTRPNTYFLKTASNEGSVDFFSDKSVKPFLDDLRKTFDITFLDMPPLLRSPSNIFIAQAVDYIFLTVDGGKTRLAEIEKCVEVTAQQGAEISGVIVTAQRVPFWCRLLFRDYFL